MSLAEPISMSEQSTAARAFGLALRLHDGLTVTGLEVAPAEPIDASTSVRLVPAELLRAPWGGATPSRVRELWHHGELLMTIDHDAAVGFLVQTPFHGSFLVCADGTAVLCAPLPEAGTSWHGLLLGQVLPIAATVCGFEVFHAAAVAIDGGAVLVSAASGVGKSTLIAHLVQRGALLVADDAVAVELVDGRLLAHPGPPLLHLFADAAAWLQGSRLRPVDDGMRAKRTLLAPSSARPLPVRAFYMLERGEPGAGPELRDGSVRPTELLGSTLTRAVRTSERLRRQLDVCAALAAKVPVRRLRAGEGPGRAASALWDDLCLH